MNLDLIRYDDIYDFLKYNQHKVFRIWKYKKMFTPYEMEQKFEDESIYESTNCEFVIFTEIIPLYNDYMLGYILADGYYYNELKDMPENKKYTSYIKLSEIEIAYAENDQKDFIGN